MAAAACYTGVFETILLKKAVRCFFPASSPVGFVLAPFAFLFSMSLLHRFKAAGYTMSARPEIIYRHTKKYQSESRPCELRLIAQ